MIIIIREFPELKFKPDAVKVINFKLIRDFFNSEVQILKISKNRIEVVETVI